MGYIFKRYYMSRRLNTRGRGWFFVQLVQLSSCKSLITSRAYAPVTCGDQRNVTVLTLPGNMPVESAGKYWALESPDGTLCIDAKTLIFESCDKIGFSHWKPELVLDPFLKLSISGLKLIGQVSADFGWYCEWVK